MMKRGLQRVAAGGIAAAFVAAMGVGLLANPVSAETTNQSVPLGGATSAQVKIDIEAGSLDVRGGAAATDLVSGQFEYGKSNGEPKVEYNVENGVGKLDLSSDSDVDFDWPWKMADDFDTDWDVLLNNTVSTDLEIDVNAGELDLALGDTNVSNLDIDLDAALGTVDLRGERTGNLTGDFDVDAGQIVLIVPTDVGVQITTNFDAVDTEINDNSVSKTSDNVYQNAAWTTVPTKITINLNMDAGQFTVKTEK
jgi:hypothetical protein